MWLAILIACGGEPAAAPVDGAPATEPAKRLNVAKVTASAASGPKKMPLEVLLTGDPSLFGTYVDAGEVWVDVGLGGMIIDENGKVVTKPDIADNIRSVGLRGIEKGLILQEKPDPNSEGNVLKLVHAIGKYQGCEAGAAGATVCYVDVGDPPPTNAPEDESKKAKFSPGVTTVPKSPGHQPPPAPAPPKPPG